MSRFEEDKIQIACANWLRTEMAYRDDIIGFHVPNGGRRDKSTAAKMKAMGVMPGVADLVILMKPRIVTFIELKADSGRKSESQKMFQENVQRIGFDYHVIQDSNPYTAVGKLARIIQSYRSLD